MSALAALQAWLVGFSDDDLVAEHRRVVLLRTKVAALLAAFVIPFTILVYVLYYRGSLLPLAAVAIGAAETGLLVVLIALTTKTFQRHYELGFFVLVGIVCCGTESALYQLFGDHTFFFPYFLILFGIATFYPAHLGWALATVLMCPLSYLAGELWKAHALDWSAAVANLVLLVNYSLIAVVGNRVTTRAFFRDVATRLALERANEKLRAEERAKSDFFSGLSHDIGGMLMLVVSPLSELAGELKKIDPDQRHLLSVAERGARKLQAMVSDLLELARIGAGVARLEIVRFDLCELLAGIVEASSIHAAKAGLSLELDVPPHAVLIDADPDKVERVIANLLSNACKFSRAGKNIEIILDDEQDDIEVSVVDEGAGIAAADLPFIFGRFARGLEGRPRRAGAGVGLAVVKEFVELHGGTTAVSSVLGKGSRFTVRLPRRRPGTPEIAVTVRPSELASRLIDAPWAASHGPRRADGPRVLLVEDTTDVRQFVTAELARDFQVVSVELGQEALNLAATQPFDAVVLDLVLPDFSGFEVCRALRASDRTAGLPVLVCSTTADMQTRLDVFEVGADDFLAKPFDARELRARLTSLCRRQHSARSNPPRLQGSVQARA
jgi:signal transduction histidine kinase/CheY-like chemotaxis protein